MSTSVWPAFPDDDTAKDGLSPVLTLLEQTLPEPAGLENARVSAIASHGGWGISFRVSSRGYADRHVRLARSNVPSEYGSFRSLEHKVAAYQAVTSVDIRGITWTLTVRDYANRVLADSPLYSPGSLRSWAHVSRYQAERRARVVRDVLRGVLDLHDAGLVHGDIRPGNISVHERGASLLDFGIRTPPAFIESTQSSFLAPEIRLGTGDATKWSDVYSVGQLIQQTLLRHFSSSENIPLVHPSAARTAWLVEDALRPVDADRPSAQDLWDALFGDSKSATNRAIFFFEAATERLSRDLLTSPHYQLSRSAATILTEHVKNIAEKYVEKAPQTSVSISSEERARALLGLLNFENVDIPDLEVHSHQHDEGVIERSITRPEQKTIDDEWRRQILLDYVDAIPQSMSTEDVELALSPEDLDMAREEIAFATEVRQDLLGSDEYFDEENLARLMSRQNLVVEVSDVATLRRWGALLGVKDHGLWIYPRFQFNSATGAPYPIISRVASRVPEDESPWTLLSWWMADSRFLDGRSPKDLVAEQDLYPTLIEAIDRSLR